MNGYGYKWLLHEVCILTCHITTKSEAVFILYNVWNPSHVKMMTSSSF